MDERELQLLKLKERRNAYVAVFGEEGKRTPYGDVILKDLAEFCAVGRESIHLDTTGRMDPYTTIYRDGKKAVYERMMARINWREPDVSNRDTHAIHSDDPNP